MMACFSSSTFLKTPRWMRFRVGLGKEPLDQVEARAGLAIQAASHLHADLGMLRAEHWHIAKRDLRFASQQNGPSMTG
jgi:hypothetical protein